MSRTFVVAVVVSSVGLCAAVVPGVFTIDEPAHLAMVASLRHGSLAPTGLDGLTPTPELAFYSPHAGNERPGLPVHELPPLYALLALPFSLLGIRGLFYLNALAFVATGALVFHLTRVHGRDAYASWVALAAFAVGSHSLEYALGLWPHMLSVALCTGGFVLASHARRADRLRSALLAGLCLGLAAGVRYPNVVYAAALGLGLLSWAPRRWESAVSFALGMAGPLVASALINGARLGSYNPISKGGGYLRVAPLDGAQAASATDALPGASLVGGAVWDAARAFWFRLVDYGARPAGVFPGFALRPEADSGAYVWYGVVKKAWLQSSPWVLLALVVLLAAFRRRPSPVSGQEPDSTDDAGRRRQIDLRAGGLVVVSVLALFALAGSGRTDGMCFNQRYLLDLVPIASFACAIGLERAPLSPRPIALGALVGAGLALLALYALDPTPSQVAVSWSPLVLAVLLVLAFWLCPRTPATRATSFLLGACLAWSAAIHLGSDVAISRSRRHDVARLYEVAAAQLPDRGAVLVWGIHRGIVAPLQLDRDLVIADATRGRGRGVERLVAELTRRGRRVFLLANGFDRRLRLRLLARFGVRRMLRGELTLMELGDSPVGAP